VASPPLTGGNTLEFDRASIYYEVSGDGPAVALVHSGLTDCRMWDAQVAALSPTYRVVRHDHRGFGRSSSPAGPAWPHRDLGAVLDAVGADSVVLVGSSFGGTVSLDYALANRGRVRGLVLIGGGISGKSRPEDVKDFAAQVDELATKGAIDAANELEIRFWIDGRGRSAEQVDPSFRARVKAMNAESWARSEENEKMEYKALDPPAIGRLEELAAPTLAVVGEYEREHGYENAELLASRVPGARMEVIAASGHLPSMERPQEFNRLLLDFLRSLDLWPVPVE